MQLEGIDNVSPAEAKIAFMSIDPGINIEIIRKYISVSIFAYYFLYTRLIFSMVLPEKSLKILKHFWEISRTRQSSACQLLFNFSLLKVNKFQNKNFQRIVGFFVYFYNGRQNFKLKRQFKSDFTLVDLYQVLHNHLTRLRHKIYSKLLNQIYRKTTKIPKWES